MNRVDLEGNLGATPELRHTTNGTPVCNLRLATNERWTDSEGNKHSRADWHRVVVWGKQAQNCCQYLVKGRSIRIEGKLTTKQWQDKDGNTHYTGEVVAKSVQFLGGKPVEAPASEAAPADNAPQLPLSGNGHLF